jgi:hypothetical protein
MRSIGIKITTETDQDLGDGRITRMGNRRKGERRNFAVFALLCAFA